MAAVVGVWFAGEVAAIAAWIRAGVAGTATSTPGFTVQAVLPPGDEKNFKPHCTLAGEEART
jgi:hypothetical protein